MVIGDNGPSPKLLYDQHRWFELRAAIKGQPASPLYKGAVAAAFNDRREAEENLARAITLQPQSADAEDAHEILANVYIRFGQYKEAVRQLDEALTIKPENADAKNARAIFVAWGRHPDQYTERFKAGLIHADVSEHGGVKLPCVNPWQDGALGSRYGRKFFCHERLGSQVSRSVSR
jgi:tetratricopeptide (TPR) repeat protein